MTVHTILFVADQAVSRDFYRAVFGLQPTLDVPGMTEFLLSEHHILGLMPEQGIVRLLGGAIADPHGATGIPRIELYVRVDDPDAMFARAIDHGATVLSPIEERSWGDRAGYVADPDGHVLAFAT